jgi:DNA-directed RNA polymerase III subunit RPC3
MMAPKDVRPLLVSLSADSLISTQEVPKSADRNPTRTFYLWWLFRELKTCSSIKLLDRYVDLQKAVSVILGNVYKTLYNIILRRRSERENGEVSAVLGKRERSDVSQDESLLTRLEREILQTWEAKEERLAALEMRVEETVFVLKDLATLCSGDE